jgi:4,5-dihydroxyphthalate decarboxylase
MAKLTVSLAGVAYDRTRAIFDGSVPIAGCEVIAHPMTPEEAFTRALSHQEFDVTELSMSNYMTLTSRGENPYVAVPAFVSRMFRHSGIYIRTDKGIDRPEDLQGKTIGVPEYPMTAALWIRGILQDEYGVAASDIHWRNGGQEVPLTKPRIAIELPPSIDLQPIPGDATLNGMLDGGELDGMMSARAPSCLETNDKVAPTRRPISPRPACFRSCIWSPSGAASSSSTPGCRRMSTAPIWRPRRFATSVLAKSAICTPPCPGRSMSSLRRGN